MQGDQLSRQWRTIRSIEANPNGQTVAEIDKREEKGIRAICCYLEAPEAASRFILEEPIGLTTGHLSPPSNPKSLTELDLLKR